MTRKQLGNGEKSESVPLIFNSHAIFSDEVISIMSIFFLKKNDFNFLIFSKLLRPTIDLSKT